MSCARRLYWNCFTLWHLAQERGLPYWPLERVTELQSRRVRSIVAHAYASVPHYRETMDRLGLRPADFQSADDLAQLPLLRGELLSTEPARLMSTRWPASQLFTTCSSGTSGGRKTIAYDRRYLFRVLACGERQRDVVAKLIGRRRGVREMMAMGSDDLTTELRCFYETNAWVPAAIDTCRRRIECTTPLGPNIAELNAFRPHVLAGLGSYIGAMYRYAWENGVDIWRPDLIWYGADHLPDDDRALLEGQFGVPVFSTYQASEVLRLAYQCEQRAGFHIHLDEVAVRVVNAAGQPVAPGEAGHIIVSNLLNRGMVLLNYALGDIVTLAAGPCPCGRSLPTIECLVGRSDDLVLGAGGRMFLAAHVLRRIADRLPAISQLQLEQHTHDRFTLRAVCSGGVTADELLAPARAALCGALSLDNVSLAVERVERLPMGPGGKVRTMISHVRRPAGAP